MEKNIEIYKTIDGEIAIQVEFEKETVWLSQNQMAELFGQTKQNISLHINNCFKEKELDKKATVKDSLTVQKEGKRTVRRKINLYNLDVIISVGYRVKSNRGTQFRQWATQRLKDYLIKGYAINQKRVEQNKTQFLKTIADLKLLSKNTSNLDATDVLSLIQNFSHTWFSLESYDKGDFPTIGTEEELELSASDLIVDLQDLKRSLMKTGQATSLFGQEKRKGTMEGIFGSVFQSVFGQDAYPSIEEKAAHLLYFTVKNHPFNDGNKRSGAFCFIWLLQKANYSFSHKITPEALTTLTLLIAESDPMEKDKLIGLILLLLKD